MNFYKLIQGDCLEKTRFIDDQTVDLAIVDPPYNMGIADWDRINNYFEWITSRFKEFERVLKDNGTMWLFHIDFPSLANIHLMLESNTNFRFKQFITINKGIQSIAGRTSKALRSYPRVTEYLIFYTFEDRTGAEQLSDKYQKINPMAKYIKEELNRAKVTCIEVAEAGHFYGKVNHGGTVSNWLSGLNMPSKSQYEKIRDYLNGKYLKREYEDLRHEYEDLRKEYEDLRYMFNLERGVTDVWDVDFYKDAFKQHPAAKPIKLIERLIKTSTDKYDVVFDPFMGSGSSMIASQHLSRSCIGIEINPKYCELIKKRCFGRQFLDREVSYEFDIT